ncbi:hypothetical protein CP973_17645 [Streptomyces albofaciens JCM 4342]|nr:hypothetical protein CP973_17645 [Streptomyces albofaciens JCM 4342]
MWSIICRRSSGRWPLPCRRTAARTARRRAPGSGSPVGTGGSRTAVAGRAGAPTRLTGLAGAVLATLVIVLLRSAVRSPATTWRTVTRKG